MKASVVASISSHTRSRKLQHEPQFAQDPKSGTEIEMKEAVAALVSGLGPEGLEAVAALAGKPSPKAPIIEGNSTTNLDDADFVYDHTCFRKYKAYHQFKDDYNGCQVAVERGLVVVGFDEHALRIWTVLKAQGQAEMVEDHRPEIKKLVRKFYANLHRRAGDSFLTWVRGTEIHVIPDLINAITGVPQVCNPEYPWLVDHLHTQVEMVMCFAEGRPYQMETEGEGSFQIHTSAMRPDASTVQ